MQSSKSCLPHDLYVQGKTAEEILADLHSADSNVVPFLQISAQVRSNQELIRALKLASDDSTNVTRKIVRLTLALVGAAILQAIATSWNKLGVLGGSRILVWTLKQRRG